jgi:hypothetical protein
VLNSCFVIRSSFACHAVARRRRVIGASSFFPCHPLDSPKGMNVLSMRLTQRSYFFL